MQLFVVHKELDLTGCPMFVFAKTGNGPDVSSLSDQVGVGEATLPSSALAKGLRQQEHCSSVMQGATRSV